MIDKLGIGFEPISIDLQSIIITNYTILKIIKIGVGLEPTQFAAKKQYFTFQSPYTWFTIDRTRTYGISFED